MSAQKVFDTEMKKWTAQQMPEESGKKMDGLEDHEESPLLRRRLNPGSDPRVRHKLFESVQHSPFSELVDENL